MVSRKFVLRRNEKKQVVIDKSGEYVVELVGRGASVEVLGALDVKGNEKMEIEVVVIHKALKTDSDVLIRAVVKDRAKMVLRGLIKIEKGAQKTNAFLKENVLLLSDKAKAEAIPNLEIEADDVKVSHAATVGKIDEEQLFYLMSRGLKRKESEKIIVDGFLAEVKNKISSREL